MPLKRVAQLRGAKGKEHGAKGKDAGFLVGSMVVWVAKWVGCTDEQHAEVAKRRLKARSTWSTKSGLVGSAKGVTTSICLVDVDVFAFGSVTNWDFLSWFWAHKVFDDDRCRACIEGSAVLADLGSGVAGVRCTTCLHERKGALRAWFSRSSLSPVQAMGVVWSVVSGIPFKHAKNGAAKGVTK